MRISSNVVVLILIVKVLSAANPICSDPNTYQSYGKSTKYKGLNDDTPWNRIKNTSDNCNLTAILKGTECGDCDFEIPEDKWIRFDTGPYVKVAEFAYSTCPQRGYCNGFYQITLIPNDTVTDDVTQIKNHFIQYSEKRLNESATTCVTSTKSFMAQSLDCNEFVLYKFPIGWNDAAGFCKNGGVGPTPYSLCMDDTVIDLTLTANRKYFTKEEDFPLTCSSTRSPKPPKIIWTNKIGQDITSKATRDTAQSSLFTAVYSLEFDSTYSSVSCKVEDTDNSQTFYKVSIQADNVESLGGKKINAYCSISTLSPEEDQDPYLIETLEDGSEVFYTPENITQRNEKSNIAVESQKVTLTISNPTVPDDARKKVENWKCGVRDPVTENYITTNFMVTINKNCGPGKQLGKTGPECEVCAENSFSSESECQDCPDGQIAGPGASTCFGIVPKDETFSDNAEILTSHCLVTTSGLALDELRNSVYMILGEEQYFTSSNITNGTMEVSDEGTNTYKITLNLSNRVVPAGVRSVVENWKCGVRDPVTSIYTTAPFSVTINKHCKPGNGFRSADDTECEPCLENTYSAENECRDCPEGEESLPESDTCTETKPPSPVYYAVAGVGGALFIILALMIGALIWTRRRREQRNAVVVLANPAHDNGTRPAANKNSSV